MLVLLFPVTTAHAGHYSAAVYSGGTHYTLGQYGLSNISDGGSDSGWGGSSGGATVHNSHGATPHADCSGAITAKFTWVTDPGQTLQTDPPPQKVYVTEKCSASATGVTNPPDHATGQVDDGLGQITNSLTPGKDSQGNPTPYSSASVSGARITTPALAADSSVTVTCTPTATASAGGTASSSVQYSASLSNTGPDIGPPPPGGSGIGGGGGPGSGGGPGGPGSGGGSTGGPPPTAGPPPSGPPLGGTLGTGGGTTGGGGGTTGGGGGGGTTGGGGGGGTTGGGGGGGTTGGGGGGGGGNTGGPSVALTGQQISANLYFNNLPVNMNTVTYQWSTSGGHPFENWIPTAIPQLLPLTSSDLDCTGQDASFTFVDAMDNDKVSVTCTATFTYTDGTPGTIIVTTPPVTFEKPTATWSVQCGYVQGLFGKDPKTDNPIFLAGLVGLNAPYPEGMTWVSVQITVPSPFSGDGSGCIAQVLTPTGTYGHGGQPEHLYLDQSQTPPVDNTSLPCLDLQFPVYQYTWPVASSYQTHGDSPNLILPDGNDLGSANSFYSISDAFDTWLMFNPDPTPFTPNPLSGDIWVPLMTYHWQYSMEVDWSAAVKNWQLVPSSANPDAMHIPQFTPMPTIMYPSWVAVQGKVNS